MKTKAEVIENLKKWLSGKYTDKFGCSNWLKLSAICEIPGADGFSGPTLEYTEICGGRVTQTSQVTHNKYYVSQYELEQKLIAVLEELKHCKTDFEYGKGCTSLSGEKYTYIAPDPTDPKYAVVLGTSGTRRILYTALVNSEVVEKKARELFSIFQDASSEHSSIEWDTLAEQFKDGMCAIAQRFLEK